MPKKYVESTGAMEIKGAKRIFSRSIKLYELKHTDYLGDDKKKVFVDIDGKD